MASTHRRSGESAPAIVRSRRSLRSVPSTAATWPWGLDVEGVVEAGHGGAALEQHAQALDERRGPFGEVGEGAFLDFAGGAEGLAQEHGGGRVAVGDAFDVHGY